MKHPRDIYAEAVAEWDRKPHYESKRFTLEDYLVQLSTYDAEMFKKYLAFEIARKGKELRDMKAIHTIITEIFQD